MKEKCEIFALGEDRVRVLYVRPEIFIHMLRDDGKAIIEPGAIPVDATFIRAWWDFKTGPQGTFVIVIASETFLRVPPYGEIPHMLVTWQTTGGFNQRTGKYEFTWTLVKLPDEF